MLKKIARSPYFLFPLWSSLVLWPLTGAFFTLKNDALTYYYPIRMLIGDALHNGELPLWTPYINMGYPLHADMQSGAWNPLVLLLGSFTRYGLAIFHLELLLYFSLAGIGFYFLCRSQGWDRFTALLLGATYPFCGFLTDSTQFFVCLAGAAWIPFILLCVNKMIQTSHWKYGIGAGIFGSLLLTGSYPALVILTGYWILFFWLFALSIAKNKKDFLRRQIPLASLGLVVVLLLSLPAILSFVRHLPYIDRGQVQSLSFVQQNSFPPLALISLLGPFAVSATHGGLATDPLMRNVYVGLLPLVLLAYGLTKKGWRKNPWLLYWTVCGIFFLLLSLGKFFVLHRLAYAGLPLFDTFRHPAIARLFFILGLLLAAGHCLHEFEQQNRWPELRRWIGRIGFFLLACLLLALPITGAQLFRHLSGGAGLQQLIASLPFMQRLLIQISVAALLTASLYFLLTLQNKKTAMLCFVLADMFIATQISLPINIIGARPFSEVKQYLTPNIPAFPLPDNRSIAENSAGSFDSLQITGSLLPFRKKIGRNDYYITPGNLSTQEKFYDSRLRDVVFNQPLFYFADTAFSGKIPEGKTQPAVFTEGKPLPVKNSFSTSGASIQPTALSSNSISCSITNPQQGLLVLQQNHYPGWQASIDDKPTTIFPLNTTFMGILTPPGTHRVLFRYHPDGIMATAGLSMFAWIMVLVLLASGSLRRFFRKQQ